MDTSYYELLDYQKMCNNCKRRFERKFNSYTRYLNIVEQKIEDFLNEYKQIEQSIERTDNLIDQLNSLELMEDMTRRISIMDTKMWKKQKMMDKYAKKICHNNNI